MCYTNGSDAHFNGQSNKSGVWRLRTKKASFARSVAGTPNSKRIAAMATSQLGNLKEWRVNKGISRRRGSEGYEEERRELL